MKRLFMAVIASIAAACSGGEGGRPGGITPVDPSDGAWRQGFDLPGVTGQGAQVYSVAIGDSGETIVGGIFTEVGGVEARNVAMWDGTQWKPFGDGLPGGVRALVSVGGDLLAGGILSEEEWTGAVWRWTGTTWAQLGGTFDGPVRTLALQDGVLIAGGAFSGALARFEGAEWTTVGGGVSGSVHTIHVVSDSSLCVGGGFDMAGDTPADNVACWDGVSWSELGDGLPGFVNVLTRDENLTWHAGGSFAFVIDFETGDYIAGLAHLPDGLSWAPLAGGVEGGFINDVRALLFDSHGALYVGGTFGYVGKFQGDVPADSLAKLENGEWSEVAGGVRNRVGVFLPAVLGVNALTFDYTGALVVGGVFSEAGSAVAVNTARVVDGVFEAIVPATSDYFGIAGLVNVLAVEGDGDVIAGGWFAGAGTTGAANVARWTGEGWEPLGSALGSTRDDVVRAVLVRGDSTIVAGGQFLGDPASPTPFLARWNGTTWVSVGPAPDGPVMALAEGPDGSLYVAGDFTRVGTVEVNRIARWDGSEWRGLGSGADERVTSIAFDAKGRLIAGGLFSRIGGRDIRGLALWDGRQWKPFGSGLDPDDYGYVSTIAVDGGDLYVAGAFSRIGGVEVSSVARWDGGKWHAVGPELTGFGGTPIVSDLVPTGDGTVLVTGTFDASGATPLHHIAWFDGTEWVPLGEGLSDLAEDLLLVDGTVWAGGGFVRAGGVPSSGFAAWDFD